MFATTTRSLHTPCLISRRRSALDYSALLERHDPVFAPVSLPHVLGVNKDGSAVAPGPTGCALNLDPDPATVFGIVVRHWLEHDIPTSTIEIMAGVLAGLLERLQTTARPKLWDTDAGTLSDFIADAAHATCADTLGHIYLRRNTINAALLSLKTLHLIDGDIPLLALPASLRAAPRGQADPARPKTRRAYACRHHLAPAAHDEVLLTRIASILVQGERSTHRCAAAVALATSTATVTEIAQVTWIHHGEAHVILSGRASADANTEKAIRPRTASLDSWSSRTLAAWHREAHNAHGYSHSHPMLYSGDRGDASTSAHASVSAQIRKAMTTAGLRGIPGLQPESLRLWAAIKDATNKQTALEAAERAGLGIATLHRIVHQLGERALTVA